MQLKRHIFDLLILDEADRLLDANFEADVQNILTLVPKERRTGLFSASVSAAVDELVRVGLRHPFKISAKVRSAQTGELDKRTPEALELRYLVTKPSHKIPVLREVLGRVEGGKAIVYVSTRAGVDYWATLLPALVGWAVFPLHGDHKAGIRQKNLRRFRESAGAAMLLTTDVLARGIDIPDIDLVVQLDPPSQPKDFIHRCGRSGRAGRKGMAVVFLAEGSEEDYVRYLEVRGTKVEPYPRPLKAGGGKAEAEAQEVRSRIREILMRKRELHDRSQKAFVSWVRAYSKTLPSDIFALGRLDWADLGRAWGLLRWPRMPELKKYFPQAVEDRTFGLDVAVDFNLEGLEYADKLKEAKRQAFIAASARGERPQAAAAARMGGEKRRKERAWSGRKDARAGKEMRREKKVVRRRAERMGKMTEGERVEAGELEALIEKVRQRNSWGGEGEGFEGFGD